MATLTPLQNVSISETSQCLPATITWTGGLPPLRLQVYLQETPNVSPWYPIPSLFLSLGDPAMSPTQGSPSPSSSVSPVFVKDDSSWPRVVFVNQTGGEVDVIVDALAGQGVWVEVTDHSGIRAQTSMVSVVAPGSRKCPPGPHTAEPLQFGVPYLATAVGTAVLFLVLACYLALQLAHVKKKLRLVADPDHTIRLPDSPYRPPASALAFSHLANIRTDPHRVGLLSHARDYSIQSTTLGSSRYPSYEHAEDHREEHGDAIDSAGSGRRIGSYGGDAWDRGYGVPVSEDPIPPPTYQTASLNARLRSPPQLVDGGIVTAASALAMRRQQRGPAASARDRDASTSPHFPPRTLPSPLSPTECQASSRRRPHVYADLPHPLSPSSSSSLASASRPWPGPFAVNSSRSSLTHKPGQHWVTSPTSSTSLISPPPHDVAGVGDTYFSVQLDEAALHGTYVPAHDSLARNDDGVVQVESSTVAEWGSIVTSRQSDSEASTGGTPQLDPLTLSLALPSIPTNLQPHSVVDEEENESDAHSDTPSDAPSDAPSDEFYRRHHSRSAIGH